MVVEDVDIHMKKEWKLTFFIYHTEELKIDHKPKWKR